MNSSAGKILIFLVLLCTSCVHGPLRKAVDKKFIKYAHFFEVESGLAFPSDLEIRIIDRDADDNSQGPKVVGYCDTFTGSITFFSDYWELSSEEAREILFLHEAGHCILDLDHNNEVDENGVPISIMVAKFVPSLFAAYKENKKPFLDRLFPWRNQQVTGAKSVPAE